ncbi:hypothetical protein QUT74_07220 [Xanthomonas citri pv. citri]
MPLTANPPGSALWRAETALRDAELHTPENRQAPLYARLAFVDTCL